MTPETPDTPNTGKPATKVTTRQKTEYLVLALYNGCWREIQKVDAVNSDAAIRDVAIGTEAPKSTTFVAVPARSWKPKTVAIEIEPRVKLS